MVWVPFVLPGHVCFECVAAVVLAWYLVLIRSQVFCFGCRCYCCCFFMQDTGGRIGGRHGGRRRGPVRPRRQDGALGGANAGRAADHHVHRFRR